MIKLPTVVCQIQSPEGPKQYVTCLSQEFVVANGLPAEAIIGVLLRPLAPGESITPAVFARNRTFIDFMQSVIARRGPDTPGLIADAKRQGDGWVYVIDQRTPTPQGAVPPEDIFGAFAAKNGQLVRGSYQASQKHQIFSENGFPCLGEELQTCLMEELVALVANTKKSNG